MAFEIPRSRRTQSISIPRQPRLNPRSVPSPGAALADGASKVIEVTAKTFANVEEARQRAELMRAETKGTTALTELEFELEKDPDFKTHGERFAERAGELRDTIAETLDDQITREKFTQSFEKFAAIKSISVRRRAFRREVDEAQADLDSSLSVLVREAALANNDLERADIISKAGGQIDDLADAGFITEQNAEKRRQEFNEEVAEARARDLITRDPETAIAALDDPGTFTALDPTDRSILRAKAVARFEKVQAREKLEAKKFLKEVEFELDTIQEIMEAGFDPGEAKIQSVKQAIDAAGVPELQQRLRSIESMASLQEQLRTRTPADLQNFVNREQTRLQAADAVTSTEIDRLVLAEKLLGRMRSELANDPLSWANRIGLRKIEPLQIIGDQATQSMQARISDALAVADYYTITPRFLTDEEATQLKGAFSSVGPDEKLQLIARISEGFGQHALRIFADMSDTAPTDAHAAGLATLGKGHIRTAQDILNGQAARGAGNDVLPARTDQETWTDETLGAGFGQMPRLRAALVESAKAIYTTRALQRGIGKDDPNEELWEAALQDAAGRRVDKQGNQWGGITEYRGLKVLIPPTIQADKFEDAILSMSDSDLRRHSVGGGPPMDTQGRVLLAKDLDQVWLVSVGHGKYYLSTTDPQRTVPLWYQGTGRRGIYELDLSPSRLLPPRPAPAIPAVSDGATDAPVQAPPPNVPTGIPLTAGQ